VVSTAVARMQRHGDRPLLGFGILEKSGK